MSSIFSDPGWSRGRTLLSGEAIELDGANNPIAGGEIVGQIKVFQDVDPVSGSRKSNRLVYCVAARYTGATALTTADAGKAYVFKVTSSAGNAAPALGEFSAVATTTDVNTTGLTFGILDEYLSMSVRTNDIVWLVVKGPTSIQTSAAAVSAGVPVQVTATDGRVTGWSTGTKVGQHLGVAASAATAGTLIRVNLFGDAVTGA